MKIGRHENVWRYGSMFRCADCEKSWETKDRPKECNKEYIQDINGRIGELRILIDAYSEKIERLEALKK